MRPARSWQSTCTRSAAANNTRRNEAMAHPDPAIAAPPGQYLQTARRNRKGKFPATPRLRHLAQSATSDLRTLLRSPQSSVRGGGGLGGCRHGSGNFPSERPCECCLARHRARARVRYLVGDLTKPLEIPTISRRGDADRGHALPDLVAAARPRDHLARRIPSDAALRPDRLGRPPRDDVRLPLHLDGGDPQPQATGPRRRRAAERPRGDHPPGSSPSTSSPTRRRTTCPQWSFSRLSTASPCRPRRPRRQ